MITSTKVYPSFSSNVPTPPNASTNGTSWNSGTSSTDTSNTTNNSSDPISNAAGGAMGKDQFMKLLITEMQNQDPMSPMDGKDLAVQLAQFTSVEQLTDINTKLDALTAAVKAASSTSTNSTTGA